MKKNKYNKRLLLKKDVVTKGKSKLFSMFILCVLFFASMYGYRCFFGKVCGVEAINKLVLQKVTITTPRGAITAEVADTKGSRERGLSGRTTLSEGKGMLFVFDTPGRYGWWVKDMKFPVDIVWINDAGVVVEIERNAKPESYPKTYINTASASYVLEIGAGEGEKQGLFIGSKVKILD